MDDDAGLVVLVVPAPELEAVVVLLPLVGKGGATAAATLACAATLPGGATAAAFADAGRVVPFCAGA